MDCNLAGCARFPSLQARILLQRSSAQVNVGGKPAIFFAVRGGHIDIASALLAAGADPAVKDKNRRSLVHTAASQPSVSVLQWLLLDGRQVHWPVVDVTDRFGLTPLHLAVAHGHFEMARYLVERLQADPLALDVRQRSVLHLACRHDHVDVLAYLAGPRAAAVTGMLGSLARYCIKHGRIAPLRYLLKLGARNIAAGAGTAVTESRETLLHHCAVLGRLDLTLLVLCQTGAVRVDVDQQDKGGWTALHVACSRGHTELAMTLLVRALASWDVRDNFGLTPFHTACRFGHLETAKLLGSCGGSFLPGTRWLATTNFLVANAKQPGIERWVTAVAHLSAVERCVLLGQPGVLQAVLHGADADIEARYGSFGIVLALCLAVARLLL